MYIVLKPTAQRMHGADSVRRILHRFGNSCYVGDVVLPQDLSMADVPLLVQTLKQCQHGMEYTFEAEAVPTTSHFAPALMHMSQVWPMLVAELHRARPVMEAVQARMQVCMYVYRYASMQVQGVQL
jgi:hypothetical protein